MTGVTILPGTRIFRSHDSRAKINHPGTPLCRHRVISHARAAPTNAGQPLGATMSSTLSPARKVPRDSILEDGTEVDDGDEWSGESESGNTIRAQVAVPNRSATLSPVSGLPRTWHTSRKGGAGNTGAYARSMRSQDHMHVLARHLERSDPYVLVVAGRQDAADLAVELGHSLGWATLCAEDIDPYDESSTDRVLARQVRRQIVCRNSCIVQAPLQDAWLYRKCLATSQDNGARLVIVCVGDR